MPRRSMHPRPMVVRSAPACLACGTAIAPSPLHKLFCSDTCNARDLYARRKRLNPPVCLERRCPCGVSLAGKATRARFCSSSCRGRACVQRKRPDTAPAHKTPVPPKTKPPRTASGLPCRSCDHWKPDTGMELGGWCTREVMRACQPMTGNPKFYERKEAANG